jgi:hypothetical protein
MILFVILLLYVYRVIQDTNSKRHLDDNFFFAHFSKINNKNFFVYPELLLTSPKHFILNEGESLYIPPKWWHWIRSEKSIAINFWCLDECTILNEPHILRDKFVNKDLIVDKISNYNNYVMVWNCSNDKMIPGKMNINRDNNYVITLPGYAGYGNTKEKLNISLLDHVKKNIVKPKYFKDKDVDINLWIANGKHDTGLHYDDKAGILSVLKGKKYITLYPPHNSSYLHPYEVVPDWAKTKPYKVEYNVFHFDRELKNALPSSRLLYESLYGAKYRSDIVQKLSTFPDRSVWGCKKQGDHMRWEVYQYQYDIKDSSKMSPLLKDKGIVITSTDVYDTSNVIGDEDHIYTCDNGNMGLPFFGHGYKNKDEPESIFVLDNKQRFKEKFGDYMKKIGFGKNVDKFHSYLDDYSAKDLCIFNKFKDQIFIMYFGLKVEDFLWFLIKFRYDTHLIQHVLTNMHMYKDICHEIAIVYDIKTGEPIRSGFYGIIMS